MDEFCVFIDCCACCHLNCYRIFLASLYYYIQQLLDDDDGWYPLAAVWGHQSDIHGKFEKLKILNLVTVGDVTGRSRNSRLSLERSFKKLANQLIAGTFSLSLSSKWVLVFSSTAMPSHLLPDSFFQSPFICLINSATPGYYAYIYNNTNQYTLSPATMNTTTLSLSRLGSVVT